MGLFITFTETTIKITAHEESIVCIINRFIYDELHNK